MYTDAMSIRGLGMRGHIVFSALALTACGSSGGDTDTATGTGTSPSTSLSVASATDGPTDGSADGTDTDSSVDGSNSNSDSESPPTSTEGPPDTDATTPVSESSDTSGPPPNCGDGIVDGGEECDDGADNGPMGACYADCTQNTCGDGVQGPDEACDLGADNGPDGGCSTMCEILASSCGKQSVEAELTPLPVDIIIVIDNSGSMSAEIQGVQDNINVNFAGILESSGIDYRVILVAEHGDVDEQSVCIEAPLSGIPQGGCANPPAQPVNNPGKFYHYSRTISSTNSWCRLLSTVTGDDPDQFGLAPTGWQEWLRPESFKTFVELSDDQVDCSYDAYDFNDGNNENAGGTAAQQFDDALRTTLPLQFGATAETRNFRWYSLIGMAYNDPPEVPYGPMDPIVLGTCPEGVESGTGYQALSNLTGGTKFPLCNTASYDVVFQAIADEVIDSAKIACEFAIPMAPMGKVLDEDSVTVIFTPGDMVPVNFMKVDGPMQCDANSFYLEAGKVILCPAACDSIQGDGGGSVAVDFTCEPIKPN